MKEAQESLLVPADLVQSVISLLASAVHPSAPWATVNETIRRLASAAPIKAPPPEPTEVDQ